MKKNLMIIILFSIIQTIQSQSILDEPMNSGNIITLFKGVDLSSFMHPKLNNEYEHTYDGIIGAKYRRIQFYFDSITQTSNPFVYLVNGKSKVDKNIYPFVGEIVLTEAKKTSNEILDSEMAIEKGRVNGSVSGNFVFHEFPRSKSTGIFNGVIKFNWGLDESGNVVSSFTDNYVAWRYTVTYKGIWRSYYSDTKLTCCWSDYQIPCVPEDFNVSDGPDIIPNEKYSASGWNNIRLIFTKSPDSSEWKKAYEEEQIKWWK